MHFGSADYLSVHYRVRTRSLFPGAGSQIICVLQSMDALFILRGRVLRLSILDSLRGLVLRL